jgi:hypothetical protein
MAEKLAACGNGHFVGRSTNRRGTIRVAGDEHSIGHMILSMDCRWHM